MKRFLRGGNRFFVLLAIGLFALLPWFVSAKEQWDGDMKASFLHPPDEARPWVYWYWMNGNITMEGALEDLRSLHRVGVGGAFLMDIGIHPAGPVSYRSPEWYEITGAVLEEAKKLNMQIGFHSPGWSASGGPWISPDKGMQEVVWTETRVTGGKDAGASPVHLPQPEARLNTYADIAVLAIPTAPSDGNVFAQKPFKVLTTNGAEIVNAGPAFDGKPDTFAEVPTRFEVVFEKPVRVRSVYFRGARQGGDYKGTMEAADSEGIYRPVSELLPSHPGPFSSRHGAVTFDAVESAKFRFSFSGNRLKDHMVLEELAMTDGYRLNDWPELAGFGTKPIHVRTLKQNPRAEDVIDPDAVLDLTKLMAADGTLRNTLPAGEWTVLRFGYVPTGVGVKPPPVGGAGLEVDKLSVEAVDYHYDQMIKPLLDAYGPDKAGTALAKYHVDSYEAGWQNWTPRMAEEFERRHGYAPVKLLPALTGRVVGDVDATFSFLWDFRRTIADLYADNHYGRLAKRAREDGLRFSNEPYGGPFEFLQVAGRSDYPMVEFWTGKRNTLPVEQTGPKRQFHGVMGAHIYGKRIMGAEAFTSEEGWIMHPYAIKSLGDAMYASGINQFVIHVSAHQPYLRKGTYPGFTSGINGIHFDRGNTWFEQGGKAWVDYMRRCQAVLQQGHHVADVLYFQGDDAPNSGMLLKPELPAGYEGDAINPEQLARLEVEQGRLVLPHGKSYSYLAMPEHGRVTYASLHEVQRLVNDGATILGPRPERSPSLADQRHDERYQQVADAIWGNATSHKGRVLKDTSFEPIFARDALPPDFSWTSKDGLVLHYTHRNTSRKDAYFVANGLKKAGYATCVFRTGGGSPELWNAVDGSIQKIAEYEVLEDGRISIPLWFDSSDSFFVVFDLEQPERAPSTVEFVRSLESGRSKLEIVRASYGMMDKKATMLDVTEDVRGRILNHALDLSGFTRLKGDPAPGLRKTLEVEYLLDGQANRVSVMDGDRLVLPAFESVRTHVLLGTPDSRELLAFKNGTFKINDKEVEVSEIQPPVAVDGEWMISFEENRGAPEFTRTNVLKSLGDFDDDGVKYFSGVATYAIDFDSNRPAEGQRMYLDLGHVEVIAAVRLNGHDLGVCWKPPFRFDVTEALREGSNELQVEVTTTWVNRLIGDEHFPDDCTPHGAWEWGGIPGKVPEWLIKGTPRPESRRVTFAAFKFWRANDPLHPAGLIGPVQIETSQVLNIPR